MIAVTHIGEPGSEHRAVSGAGDADEAITGVDVGGEDAIRAERRVQGQPTGRHASNQVAPSRRW